jgi:hypothetical protein
MNERRWASWASMAAVGAMPFVAGCQPGKPTAPAPPTVSTSSPPQLHLTNAQPKLPTIKLWLGAQEVTAELALTRLQISTGMMFRTNLAEHEGMLFVFALPHRASFYMKNTLLPLSCAYLDPDGTILEIRDMKPLDETPIEAATDRVQYVLEMKQGWFERNKVTVGAEVRTERGSLRETFFRGRPEF